MQKIVIDRFRISDIPVLTIYPHNVENAPLIIYAHGLGGEKNARLDLGCLLAEAGFYFIAFDAQMHGERVNDNLHAMLRGENLTYPAATQIDFIHLVMKTVVQNASDIDTIIKYYSTNNVVDLNRVGMIGTSMGGCTTFYVAANNPLIKVAIPMMASPNFTKTWDEYVIEQYALNKWCNELDNLNIETRRIRDFISSIDPIKKLSEFAPKPLLIIGGECDSSVPKSYLIEGYGKLLEVYRGNEDKLQLKLYKGVGHSTNMSIFSYACKWFKKYL